MAGKGGIYRLLILVIAALAACSSPVGSIGGPAASRGYDGLLVEYTRFYKTGDYFKWGDLKLFTVTYSDVKKPVIPDDVKVEDPVGSGRFNSVPTGGYLLEAKGERVIMVEYEDLSIKYTIEVLEPGAENQASGIIIQWVT